MAIGGQKEYLAAYYQKNKEKIKLRSKERYYRMMDEHLKTIEGGPEDEYNRKLRKQRERYAENPELAKNRAACAKRLRERNPERAHAMDKQKQHRHREKYANARRMKRKLVLDAYGGACSCCGESTFEFLALDHVEGNGWEHRQEVGMGSYAMLRWAIKNKFPDTLQILCHNCNKSKYKTDICAHKRSSPNPPVRNYIKLRHSIIRSYGGVCECCGEANIWFLELDHLNGGGSKHIKGFSSYYKYLCWIRDNRPSFIRVLCANCNYARAFYGTCPHQRNNTYALESY